MNKKLNSIWKRKTTDANEQKELGCWYFEKGEYRKACKYFLDSANQGNAVAQYNLSVMYLNGIGIPKNYDAALNFGILAANQGNIGAQTLLGSMYLKGNGISQNYDEAFKWFTKAEKQGNEKNNHEHIYFNGLGSMYLNGLGCKRNIEKATKYYELSMKNGDIESTYILEKLSQLNSRQIKIIHNIAELDNNQINEDLYGAIQIISKENNTYFTNYGSLYSIEEYKACRRVAEEILKGVPENNNKNEFEIFSEIYIKLAHLIKFDDYASNTRNNEKVFTSSNLIGGLLQGEAVCAGYAEILRNLLALRGIECRNVRSKEHSFNQVKINGKWYYCDLTWDRDFLLKEKKLKWCLLSKKSFEKYRRNTNHIALEDQIVEDAPEDFKYKKIYKQTLPTKSNTFAKWGSQLIARFYKEPNEQINVIKNNECTSIKNDLNVDKSWELDFDEKKRQLDAQISIAASATKYSKTNLNNDKMQTKENELNL